MFINPIRARLPLEATLFFSAALLFLFAGVGLGLYMAASHDHSLAPVHAHTNLLGWVSCAIMGLFYTRSTPLTRRMILTQFGVYTAGVVAMMIGLVGVLKTIDALLPFLAVGTLGTIAGIILFACGVGISLTDSLRPVEPVARTWESG